MKNIHSIKDTFFAAGSYVITHIPNCCMMKIWSLFTLVKISGKRRKENQTVNKEVLEAASAEKAGFFSAIL